MRTIASRVSRDLHRTMPYHCPPRVKAFFESVVNANYEKRTQTKAWKSEVLANDWRYHSELVERGRVSFSGLKNGLSPQELIAIYCYYYMQQHAASGFHVLYRANIDSKLRFMMNPVMIDFGCGPSTGAISFAWYNMLANSDLQKNTRLHYIGVDSSVQMLDHAKAVISKCTLFDKSSMFTFLKRRDAEASLANLVREAAKRHQSKSITYILNCSYYFGSNTLIVSMLVTLVKKLLSGPMKGAKVCLVYQNANYYKVNEKWSQFKEGIAPHLETITSELVDSVEYKCVTGKRSQGSYPPTQLRRELLVNSVWKKTLTVAK